MHYPHATSANMVTNFMGTSFLLSVLGGFIGDSIFTRFTTFIVFCTIELLVLSIYIVFGLIRPIFVSVCDMKLNKIFGTNSRG